MKIAIVLYGINNMGGIINHTEELIAGFKELGHETVLFEAIWKDKVRDQKRDTSTFSIGHSGLFVDQGRGWCFPAVNRLPYKGVEAVERSKAVLSGFDLIIWQIPVPTMQEHQRGNSDWLGLYDVPVKQIAVIHDGNLENSYPWLASVADNMIGLACVHPCAYATAENIPLPRAMIFNPQPALDEQAFALPYEKRNKGFVNCQIFKGWKHVDDLVKAIAYMPAKESDEFRFIAGGGLEQAYMTSPNKCKDRYKYLEDPTSPWYGRKIWDVAVENGMEFLGYIDNQTRDSLLSMSRLLIDPSWSNRYSKKGDHFNRVVVDAIRMGAIPVARPLGISDNLEGNGVVFKAGVNYLSIPHSADTPKKYADYIVEYSNMPSHKAEEIRNNCRETFNLFDRKVIAQQFIDLSNGNPTGYYNDLKIGKLSEKICAGAEKAFAEFWMV